MKPLNLILDYTEAAKTHRKYVDEKNWKMILRMDDRNDTTLKLYYPHAKSDRPDAGEHCSTFPEVRTPEAGRKAAKTFMKYCPNCKFIDKTKE